MSLLEKRIVVVGGGGHAKVLISVILKTPWQIVGYTDSRDGGALLGVPRLGDDSVLADLLARHPDCAAILGVGKIDASPDRFRLQQQMEALGFHLPVIVSPDAVVNAGVELGCGSVAFDQAVVNVGTVAGKGCIINTNCTVEHDCRLGDNVHVAPGATISGGVTIGSHSFIGAGATVVQGRNLAESCIIGAGAVVTADITVAGTYAGAPARRIG